MTIASRLSLSHGSAPHYRCSAVAVVYSAADRNCDYAVCLVVCLVICLSVLLLSRRYIRPLILLLTMHPDNVTVKHSLDGAQ